MITGAVLSPGARLSLRSLLGRQVFFGRCCYEAWLGFILTMMASLNPSAPTRPPIAVGGEPGLTFFAAASICDWAARKPDPMSVLLAGVLLLPGILSVASLVNPRLTTPFMWFPLGFMMRGRLM